MSAPNKIGIFAIGWYAAMTAECDENVWRVQNR